MKKSTLAVLVAAAFLTAGVGNAVESARQLTAKDAGTLPVTTAKLNKKMSARDVIDKLGLTPIPDNCGGDYKEIYRSACLANTAQSRNCASIIYHLIKADYMVPLHKMASDETFTYLAGSPQLLVIVHADGSMEEVILGSNLLKGEVPVKTVPAGCWFAEKIKTPSKKAWSLVSITVTPGFDSADFADGDFKVITEQFPEAGKRLAKLGFDKAVPPAHK